MKIIGNTLHAQFHTQDAFQPGGDGDRTLLIAGASLPETGIGLQHILVGTSEVSAPRSRRLSATSCAISCIPWPWAETLGWPQKRCRSASAASLCSSIQVKTGSMRSAGVEIDITILLSQFSLLPSTLL